MNMIPIIIGSKLKENFYEKVGSTGYGMPLLELS